MTSEPNDKLRALFLSALMVMSVIAMSVAFAGTAAAANVSPSDADDNMQSGQTFWQGQELYFDGTGGGGSDVFQIRRVNDDGEVGTLVSEFTVDATTKEKIINTENLEGDFVIVNSVSEIVRTGSGGTVTQTYQPGGAQEDSNVSQSEWEVAIQTLDAEFDDDDLPVRSGETATIEMDSNRGTYAVNISAAGLDEDDLGDIFNQSADQTVEHNFIEGTDSDDDDDDTVQVQTTADGEIEANFSVFDDTGTFTFDFEVNDTTAETSVSVNVEEEDVQAEFGQTVYAENVGDEVTVDISVEDTSTVWLFVGGEDVNYLESIELVDDDDDGEITLTMNTWLMGRNTNPPDNSSATGTNGAFDVEGDDVINDVTRYNDTDFPGEEIDIASQLFSPLENGDYDMILSSSGTVTADDDELTIEDEEAIGTLNLVERSTDSIQTWVAPRGSADIDDDELQELLDDATPSSRFATGDRLIVQVEASGLYGYVDDEELQDIVGTTNNGVNGLNLTIQQTNAGGNKAGKVLDLSGASSSQAELHVDPDNDTFYVIIDTRSSGIQSTSATGSTSISDGQDYDAEFQVGVRDNGEGIDYTGANNVKENPYLDADEEEIVTSEEFGFLDADADFLGLIAGELEVEQNSNVTVRGTTNVAPNTELQIRLRKAGGASAFLKTATVDVGPNRRWSANFDFTDVAVGTTFTATVQQAGSRISDEEDGVVVGQATASLTFNDQASPGGASVIVQSATLSRGGFVAIHRGSASGPIIGVSKQLPSGDSSNVRIALDEEISETTTLVAMPHQDMDGNNVFNASEDGPYMVDGAAVTDDAEVQVASTGTVITRTVIRDSPTPIIRTADRTVVRTREVTRTIVRTSTPGQPGFGIAIAVVALLAAAMLAVRRRD